MGKKEELLVKEICNLLEGYDKARNVFRYLIENKEIREIIEQANILLEKRLGFTDHGIIHALIVTRNAIKIAKILKNKGFTFDIEKEGFNFEDVLVSLILSAYLHDTGNSIHRKFHQLLSVIIVKDYIEEILRPLYPERFKRLTLEVLHNIISHQGEIFQEITLEAKVVAIADGLDMEEGRARYVYKTSIPDIHTYSALSVKRVDIKEGSLAPIRIDIYMENPAGIFLIEEILGNKIKMGNSWNLLEIYIYIESTKDLVKIINGRWLKEKIN